MPARSAFRHAPPKSIRLRRSRALPPRWRTGAIADDALLVEAAAWHARLARADDATRAAFAGWRAARADHAAAYARVCAAHDHAATLAEHDPLLALRGATLARTAAARRSRKRRWRVAAAGALVLAGAPLAAFGIRAFSAPPAPPPYVQTFRTGIGQQTDVTLPDGSVVTLDTASTLEVRFGAGARAAKLDGQGWFRITPGAAPFQIHAGGRDFTAREGVFDVRTDADRVRAFAAAGHLTLESDGSSVALAPGRLLAVRNADVVIRTPEDPTNFTGWRTGLLQFDDTPLAEAVAEFNRYSRRPIRIADGRVGALRVSGAFRTTGAPAFVGALTTGFPVRVQRDARDGIVIAAR
ncbi:FecR domain-containing protein [Sphingomonas sp. H39-1-10]|uniref:FecR family protein n=1 Tax=Sphingomonas pollutisoli TaxID=3030829 RepID=UPI0023B9B483|nr:FecR domain-containing protein [Sphingomonas pollutisoli]MDF0490023.1 FecR domain-containing protein [Sphingomonas pollutisoli]